LKKYKNCDVIFVLFLPPNELLEDLFPCLDVLHGVGLQTEDAVLRLADLGWVLPILDDAAPRGWK
jgi:hypothetical protein